MPIFRAENNHSPQYGTPPSVDNDDRNIYVGYFQNEHAKGLPIEVVEERSP
jgi:hypothetical protein